MDEISAGAVALMMRTLQEDIAQNASGFERQGGFVGWMGAKFGSEVQHGDDLAYLVAHNLVVVYPNEDVDANDLPVVVKLSPLGFTQVIFWMGTIYLKSGYPEALGFLLSAQMNLLEKSDEQAPDTAG